MAYQEVDVGNAVKLILMSFTTAKKLSPELVISGTLLEARRTCLYFSDCQEVAYDARQKLNEELKRARVYIRTKPDP